jgi:predicted pyridoxine 5'-phosphate oxidase superfamily flavin-nucleotide-binding protein
MMPRNLPQELADAKSRRAQLLLRCQDADNVAGMLRVAGKELDSGARAGFRFHDQLRVVEREIYQLQELIAGGGGKS